jgi:hypothetical protein
MSAPARQWTASQSTYEALASGQGYDSQEFFPGERIGAPLKGARTRAVLRGLLLASIVAGGGWLYQGGRVSWPDWLSMETVSQFLARKAPPPADPKPEPQPVQPLASSEVAPAPGEAATPPALAEAATTESATKAAAIEPEAEVDPADPYQKRAMAVGLHPDLSRVLLAKLTPTDYRNAGIAVETALAETPDSSTFIYPRQRKADLALFEVHFVPGAPAGCRRYVVAITKDGWLTTALPLERCGAKASQQKRG